jgi:mono/diheme cytochrome c family protein
VEGSDERLVAIILKGISGPISVNGSIYVNVMPPQEMMLSDDKIADVVSFVRASFGNSSPVVSPETVGRVRKRFSERKEPWTEAELKSFSAEGGK